MTQFSEACRNLAAEIETCRLHFIELTQYEADMTGQHSETQLKASYLDSWMLQTETFLINVAERDEARAGLGVKFTELFKQQDTIAPVQYDEYGGS